MKNVRGVNINVHVLFDRIAIFKSFDINDYWIFGPFITVLNEVDGIHIILCH